MMLEKKTKEIIFVNKTKKTQLLQQHLKIIKDKQDFVKKTKEKQQKKIDDAVDILHNDGMWTSKERVDLEVGKIKKKSEKMSEIKKQITLYKNVYALDKNLKNFTKFSEKGHQFNIDKLLDNLKFLIEHVNQDKSEGEKSFNPQKLVSKLFYHVWTNEEGENIEWNGQIIEYKNGIFKVISC